MSFKIVIIIVAFAIILFVAIFFLIAGKEWMEKLLDLFWNTIKGGGNQGS